MRRDAQGLSGTREYRIWNGILTRCTNAKNPNFKNYGARGITMCERWFNSFPAFLEDMGPSNGLCIDRIDNDLGYEPGNCRWVTHQQNSANRRVSHFVEFEGRKITIAELARMVHVPQDTLLRRLRCGWSIEHAVVKKRARPGKRQAPQFLDSQCNEYKSWRDRQKLAS